MTREEIITFAKQVNAHTYTNRNYLDQPAFAFGINKLEEFVRLIQKNFIPDGYKLVPIEPTELMENAGVDAGGETFDGWEYADPYKTYKAMIEKSPTLEEITQP